MPEKGFPAAGATVVVGLVPDIVLVISVVVGLAVVLTVVLGAGAGAEPGRH